MLTVDAEIQDAIATSNYHF